MCVCVLFFGGRCDPATVGRSKAVELILSRLSLFLQGKWCLPLAKDAGDEERAAAEEEMKDWFAGAEQVSVDKIVLCVFFCVCVLEFAPAPPPFTAFGT